jgi:hypothetical protein
MKYFDEGELFNGYETINFPLFSSLKLQYSWNWLIFSHGAEADGANIYPQMAAVAVVQYTQRLLSTAERKNKSHLLDAVDYGQK